MIFLIATLVLLAAFGPPAFLALLRAALRRKPRPAPPSLPRPRADVSDSTTIASLYRGRP